ncbi:beta-ketoacyl synthase [Fusarium avenaceum]|nr:beta-ketoacyl synthase [Fusarium avenaceum]
MPHRRLILFGGQGSQSIFSPNASKTAVQDAQSVSTATILLSRCHAAFLEEIATLDGESQRLLAIDLLEFVSPVCLLKPAVHYHRHPVLQATTIYLCQILRYLAVTLQDGVYEHCFEALESTAGFSSGMIPAMVVARSSNVDEFLSSGVEGFRLAFWISCRSLFWTHGVDSEHKDNVGPEATLSLVTRGLTIPEVEEKLREFHSRHGTKRLQISSILTSGSISISGPEPDLCLLQEELQTMSGMTTTFAHVHGWYHGGEQLQPVVSQVMEDVERRSIFLSPCSQPIKPMYSTLDGQLLDESTTPTNDVLEWLTRHLLMYCVDWSTTSHAMAASIQKSLSFDTETKIKIISLGPSSTSLFPPVEKSDPRIQLLDVSSFNSGKRLTEQSSIRQDDIAIVGMNVQLPKGRGTDELWETLSQGLNAAQEIPGSRFELSDFHADDVDKPRSMSTRHGAFLEDPFSFDNTFFNISPREAKSMDPQQRILLHAAQEALEDAGYVPDSTPSSQRATTGCYIGLATGDYTDNLRNDIDTFYPSGTLRAFHSGRISYFYRFSGPSIVTDTACSSSTVSIYQACRAIQNGDCTAAIAGGVNVITSPDMYLGLARGHFLSPTGNCKPFDAAADGYCRAEGCVLFVLKRLSDAVAEGDRIHGVIKSAQINQSGNSSSITHPHSTTQTELLNRLLEKADVDPATVSVVEAHGTGTQAGDAREVETLKRVFSKHHSSANPLIVSSIKGNIGHCEATSGAAGLAKLLLMFRNNEIPMQAGLNTLNPVLGDLQSSGLLIPRQNMAWLPLKGMPRRAVLNNFGAAGSNASLLIEEWMGQKNKQDQAYSRSAYVFALSAKSEKALQSAVDRHIDFLAESHAQLADICYTATSRRQYYDHRFSIACSSKGDLLAKLQQLKATSPSPARKVTSTVFVFTGQGALYNGMGRELMSTYPPFKDIISSCDRVIKGLGVGCPSILNYIQSHTHAHMDTLTNSEHLMASQCACIALEYALATTFITWGIKPDYLIGHSLGEYAALCVSGVLALEDTFRIVASRAKMMDEYCPSGTSGMLACHMTPKESQAIISTEPALDGLSLACHNGARDCVIGGPLTQLEALQKRCKTQSIRSKLINVPYAFHTSAMDPIMEHLRVLGRTVKYGDAAIPVISNVDGRLLSDNLTSDYFADHARQPVCFQEGILSVQSLIGSSNLDDSLFIEIGPQPTLLPMLRDSIPSSSCAYLGTLQKGRDAWVSLTQTVAAISLRKVPVNWRGVFTGTSAEVVSLPGHLLQGRKFFIPFQEHREVTNTPSTTKPVANLVMTQHPLLPWLRTDTSSTDELKFETDMATLGPLISGHDVGGTPICPASVFHELAVEAAQTLLDPTETQVLVASDISFSSPLVYLHSSPSHRDTTVCVHITRQSNASPPTAIFKVTSRASPTYSTETAHCSGNIVVRSLPVNSSQWARDHALVSRQSRHFSGAGKDQTSTFRTKLLYETIFTRVVKYGPEYQTLQYIDVADSNLEGIGSFKIPSSAHRLDSQRKYLVNPVFTDTLLHAAGFIANLAIGSNEIGICSGVESMEIAYHEVDYRDTFKIYCNLLEIKGAILADSIAIDSSNRVAAVVRGMEFKKLQLTTFQLALSRMSSGEATKPDAMRKQQLPARLTSARMPDQTYKSQTNQNIATPSPAYSSPARTKSGMSQVLRDIVVEVGGFTEQNINYTMSLADLGIDSMMQIEIASKLSRLFPGQAGLSHHALSECETLEELDSMLLSVIQPSSQALPRQASAVKSPSSISQLSSSESTQAHTPASSASSDISELSSDSRNLPVTLHTSEGTQTPLCLFHDGSGQISMYKRLRGHDRTVHAFFDPYFCNFEGRRSFYSSVEQMAEDYVSMIISNAKCRSSPLILGGWSFGGIVAYQAAQHLTNRGFNVKGLVLIDSPSPVDHEPLPAAIITDITNPSGQPGPLDSGSSKALEEEFISNASLLGIYKPRSFTEATGRSLKTIMLRSRDVLDTEALYGVNYDWLSHQDTRDAAIGTWEELVGGHIDILPIPGDHFQPFAKDKVDETAAQLWRACRNIERS